MAVGLIECNKNFPPIRDIVGAVKAIREQRDRLRAAINSIQWGLRDGDGSNASHYAAFASEGEIVQGAYASANAAAKTLHDEAESLVGKLEATGGDATGQAIDKLCGFLGE